MLKVIYIYIYIYIHIQHLCQRLCTTLMCETLMYVTLMCSPPYVCNAYVLQQKTHDIFSSGSETDPPKRISKGRGKTSKRISTADPRNREEKNKSDDEKDDDEKSKKKKRGKKNKDDNNEGKNRKKKVSCNYNIL